MTNRPEGRDDFEFDDFFDDDTNRTDAFDIGDGDEPPIGDDFGDDMPEMDEEPERSNRTFVILAVVLILIFIIGVAIVVLLAGRDTGPNEAEQTATQVVILNSTVQAFAAETATQDLINLQATQTALSFTPTPTDTPLPTETPTPEPPTATPSPDATLTAAFLALDSISQTQTALAASPTPTETLPPSPTVPLVDIQALFATEAAQATQIGQFQQSAYATAVAIVTQAAAEGGIDPAALQQILQEQSAQLGQILAQGTAVAEAVGQIDVALATAASLNATLSFNLALATSNAPGLQGQLQTPEAAATLSAGQIAATLTSFAPNDPALPQATATALGQQASLQTPAGLATQSAFATRLAFVQEALGTLGVPATATPTVAVETPAGLSPVNQTATAIAGAFLTATAQARPPEVTEEAGTPIVVVPPTEGFAPPPTALPDTGLFDDIGADGSSLGILGVALLGLVGVIVAARILRSRNK